MNRQTVKSTDIKSVGYDQTKHILEIEFHSGSIYQYSDVSENMYQRFMKARSHGSFFHSNIKKSYKCKKIG